MDHIRCTPSSSTSSTAGTFNKTSAGGDGGITGNRANCGKIVKFVGMRNKRLIKKHSVLIIPDGYTMNPTPSNTNRRRRTTFSPTQLRMLEDVFSRQQYLVGNERLRLAALLNIGVTQLKVWFQNRRIRWRREQREMILAHRYEAMTTTCNSSTDSSSNELTTGVALPKDLISTSTSSSENRSVNDN